MFKGWPLGLRSHSGCGVTGVAQSSSTLILVETASYIPHAPLQVPVHNHHLLQTVSMNPARINRATPPQMPVATKDRSAPLPPSISMSTSQATKSAPQPPKQRKPRPDSSKQRLKQPPPAQASTEAQPPVRPAAQRDPGVSDVVWNRLQADIVARKEAKRKAAEEERLQQGVQEAEMQKQITHTQKLARECALATAKENVEKQCAIERQREIERQLEKAQRRETEVRTARERAAAELKRKQKQEERRKQEAVVQEKLRYTGICSTGFQWIKQPGGYRCAGGSHFMTDAQEEERRKREVVVQEKLRYMGTCPAGYQWIKQPSGYRCAGGSHFMTDAQKEETRKQEEERRRQEEERRKQEEEKQKQEEERRKEEEETRKQEEEKRKQEEMQKQEAVVQEKLRCMGICPAGYQWIKQPGGYRCAAGSHFVTDAQLGL